MSVRVTRAVTYVADGVSCLGSKLLNNFEKA